MKQKAEEFISAYLSLGPVSGPVPSINRSLTLLQDENGRFLDKLTPRALLLADTLQPYVDKQIEIPILVFTRFVLEPHRCVPQVNDWLNAIGVLPSPVSWRDLFRVRRWQVLKVFSHMDVGDHTVPALVVLRNIPTAQPDSALATLLALREYEFGQAFLDTTRVDSR